MNVHASGNQHAQQPWMTAKPRHSEARGGAQDGIARTKESEIAVPAEAAESEGSKGVIRLLQAGHFAGVADVRLRINFHDQLQQLAAENAGKALDQAMPGLLGELADKVHLLGEEHGLSEQGKELIQSFEEEIKNLLAEARTTQAPLTTTLGNIKTSFSAFLESLQGAFAGLPSPVGEESAAENDLAGLPGDDDASATDDQTENLASAASSDENVEESGEGQESDDGTTAFKTALQELEAWFGQRMDSLHSDATAAQQLPPLSQPRGDGRAYSKFLEIYRALGSGIENNGASAESKEARLIAEA